MEREQLNRHIGTNIRKYRLKADISQENLALAAGLYPAYLGRLERGEKCPTVDTLYKICNALGVPVCELLEFDEDKPIDNDAAYRIEKALKKLPEQKQKKLAKIVENITDIME